MTRSTDDVIADLVRDVTPIRRLAPPLRRALLWLAAVAAVAAIVLWRMADIGSFLVRAADPRLATELAVTLATGVLGVVAAFHLSVPDRSRLWALAPLPPLGLWLASSGYECWKTWIGGRGNSWAVGESAMCFMFIVAVGLTLALLLFWPLRKARPLQPGIVVLTGGLGVAGLASFLLQFFHPFDVTFMDLGLHVAAVAVLLGIAWGPGRRAVSAA